MPFIALLCGSAGFLLQNASARPGGAPSLGSTPSPQTPVLLATITLPAPSPAPPSVRFNGHQFAFDPNASAALAECQRRLGNGGTLVALVGLTARPGPRLPAELAERGVELLDYVPDDGWVARVRGTSDPLQDPHVFCFQPLDASLRVHTKLSDLALGEPASEVPVYVHAVADRSVTSLAEALADGGFAPLTSVAVGDRQHLAGVVAASQFPAFLRLVANHTDTLWVEPGRGARLFNARAARSTQSGAFNGGTPFFERGIIGAGQVIAVCDTGLDVDSCFFRDSEGRRPPVNRLDGLAVDWTMRKVVAATFLDPDDDPDDPAAWDNHGHGTAVAGSAAGSSLYAPWDPQADNGMAPGAWLIIQDAGYRSLGAGVGELPGLGYPVTNFYPVLRQAVALGASIQNISWGDLDDAWQPNLYSQTCRELDLVTWSNKHFLVVCAAGNNSFTDSVGSPSTAKNGLSVAASLAGSGEGRVASYSSRGWASDGRFKPDLTAPGQVWTAGGDGDITTENCYRANRAGTSFAAPVVAGLAALVRDYFAQGFHPTGSPVLADEWPDVSAALAKAVLINATVPMSAASAPPPARDQGWGRVNLSRTLRLSPDGPALLGLDHRAGFAHSPAFPHRTFLRVTGTNRPLKVTLVWSDYPATPGADQHLVNDLDLRVRTPSLALKGNHIRDGQSLSGGDFDRLNNVEQVVWTPAPGELLEVSVWARRIVVGPQDCALVASGEFEVIPLHQDQDADGLPDYWEHWHFGSLDARPEDDPDGDGATNAAEFAANTDPTDAASVARLEIARLESGGITLSMRVSEGREYVLEQRVAVAHPEMWMAITKPLLVGDPIGEGRMSVAHPAPATADGPAAEFFRVRIQGPP